MIRYNDIKLFEIRNKKSSFVMICDNQFFLRHRYFDDYSQPC